MMGNWIEAWGFWDGYLEGVYMLDEQIFYFVLDDRESWEAFYPETKEGRIYSTWRLTRSPEFATDFMPPGDPTGTVTEQELNQLPARG